MPTSTMQLFISVIRNARSHGMNRAMIGHTVDQKFPPVPREAIAEFARATRDENPIYNSLLPPVPPFFIGKLVIPLVKDIWAHPSLKMNLLRTVQIFQSVTWFAPIREGDEVSVQGCIENICAAPKGEIIEISGTGRVKGQIVVQGNIGFLVKSKVRTEVHGKSDEKTRPEAFRLLLPTAEGQQLLYAKASGDNNFIHTSGVLARMAGFPRTIMHGNCTLAMICNALSKRMVDNDIAQLASLACHLGKPVFPGETLTIVGYRPENENTLPFAVFNARGKAVIHDGIFTVR
ncbi:MaoC/PaaZ C-terminal domain-containing protein [Desulfomonile tiedjei]|uniref:Acyl dehydratase n=1 Tax=Desulfomonile tiedjei (strain ATCC 49306 / DSM 6799 / DCB-1) TaxID=706587 RepID=I4C2Z5_DESTA|nr:MaoC/PaaZ C-terminal domain-containing protein [Desulfomonile tiedjei]AFM23936.1 acyl dehydratase [Desulfomonile tiedjei DSM 6799]